jgi:hypothetical protein
LDTDSWDGMRQWIQSESNLEQRRLEAKCYTIGVQKPMFDLLEIWLHHKSDMVNFEAACAVCPMKNITSAQLTKSIH